MVSCNLFLLAVATFFANINAAVLKDGDSSVKVPEDCKGKKFCSIKPEGYTRELEDLINSKLPKFMLQDYADRIDNDEMYGVPKLSPESDWQNCPYTTTTQLWYMHDANAREVIIQTDAFKQEVVEVECMVAKFPSGNVQCFQDLINGNAFNMASSCRTNYSTRTLYYWDLHKQVIVPKLHSLPTSCSCSISYND